MPKMPMPDDNYARQTNHDYIGSFGRILNEPKTITGALNSSDIASSEIIIAFHGELHFSHMVSTSEKHKSEQYHL